MSSLRGCGVAPIPLIATTLLAPACGSDQKLGETLDPTAPTQTETTETTDAPPTTTPPTTDTDTLPQVPPPPTLEDCPSGLIATMDLAEIWVGSIDPPFASATLDSPTAGWYHLYNEHVAESGDGQWKESAYLRVINAGAPSGHPLFANCGADWIVVDLDNLGPASGTQTYVGTFWLEAGANTLEMRHYCERYRNGECASLHIADDPDSACDTDNINSVHFVGSGVCLTIP